MKWKYTVSCQDIGFCVYKLNCENCKYESNAHLAQVWPLQASAVVSTFLQQQTAASDCLRWRLQWNTDTQLTILMNRVRLCSNTGWIQLLFCQREQLYLLSPSRSMHLYFIAVFYFSCIIFFNYLIIFNVPLIAPRGWWKCFSDCVYTGICNLNINIFLAEATSIKYTVYICTQCIMIKI